MKSKFVADLKIGEELENVPFLLEDVARRSTKDGRSFLLFSVRDKTGQASGVFWDVPEHIANHVQSGLVMLITGRVHSFKDSLQVTATDLNLNPKPDWRDFLPSSTRPREELLAALKQEIGRLDEPWQTLVRTLLLDPAFLEAYTISPAARGMHHAYIGGLLEHSLSMTAVARFLAKHYPLVNENLLVAGTLLHDMGKTSEYSTEGGFTQTDDGRLVGHILRGLLQLQTVAHQIHFPEADLQQLIHLIASHHGTLEWGSPVVPKTIEAVLLHQIDLLDSRMQGFIDHVRSDPTGDLWTSNQSRMFGTELRRPSGLETN